MMQPSSRNTANTKGARTSTQTNSNVISTGGRIPPSLAKAFWRLCRFIRPPGLVHLTLRGQEKVYRARREALQGTFAALEHFLQRKS